MLIIIPYAWQFSCSVDAGWPTAVLGSCLKLERAINLLHPAYRLPFVWGMRRGLESAGLAPILGIRPVLTLWAGNDGGILQTFHVSSSQFFVPMELAGRNYVLVQIVIFRIEHKINILVMIFTARQQVQFLSRDGAVRGHVQRAIYVR